VIEARIKAVLNGLTGYAVELQRGLTAIPALDPSSGGEGELDKAVWLEGQLRQLPFDRIERYDAPDGTAKGGVRPNLIAVRRGREATRTLWIMSHLDVVPPGPREAWDSDPYTLRVEDGKLYGRGTEDNQQAVVSSVLVARAMMELELRPDVDLGLLFCADEETGSKFGAHFLGREHPELFGPRDMVLVPDAGNPEGTMVEIAEKSAWWMKVHTIGRQCHGSTPEQGINAFTAASRLVTAIGTLYQTFPQSNPLFHPPISTFEPTKKEPNVPNVNTIPGEDVFYADLRVLPEVSLAEVEGEVRRLAREVEAATGVRIEISDVQRSQAAPPTAPDDELVRTLVTAIRDVNHLEPAPCGIGGGTVAAVFRAMGLPAVVYSRILETAHQPNEHCILDNLINDALVFGLTLLRCPA
jgi:succinyl-diaminopimelate desuccinylase